MKALLIIAIALVACTVGTTNKVTVNQYGEIDSTKNGHTTNIYILKDTVKTKTK